MSSEPLQPVVPNFDLSQLPNWMTFIGFLIYAFRQQIGSLLRLKARSRANQDDLERELVVSQLDHEFQTVATDQLADVRREDRLLSLLEKRVGFLEDTVDKKMECLLAGQNRTNELLSGIRSALETRPSARRTRETVQ